METDQKEQVMKGKTCLVTGANRGIGKATATGLAKLGATVIMVCRDATRGKQAQLEIQNESRNHDVDLMIADLASLSEIKRLAADFKDRYQNLHVLINSAGVIKKKRTLTEDRLEMTFAVNHLAPFVLTGLLLDTLKSSAPARIVNVSSMVHKWGEIDFEDLQGEIKYDMDKAYNQSKLANVLFSYELSRRLMGTGVTVNCLEPGMVATDFGREYTGFKAMMSRLWRVFMKNPEQGAETPLYLATSPAVEGISGQYFANKRAIRSSEITYDTELAERLWGVSEALAQI